jgi:hypothetical protein
MLLPTHAGIFNEKKNTKNSEGLMAFRPFVGWQKVSWMVKVGNMVPKNPRKPEPNFEELPRLPTKIWKSSDLTTRSEELVCAARD